MTTPMTLERMRAMVRRKQARVETAKKRAGAAIADTRAARESLAKALRALAEFELQQRKGGGK